MHDLSSGCDTCDQLAAQVESVSADDQAYEGGRVRVIGSTRPYVKGEEAQLVFDVTQAPLSIVAGGQPIEGGSFPEKTTSGGGGILRWDASRTTWLFTQWTVK
jgi:hypothetical protein